MFYDLPEPVTFAKDVHSLLADDGIWTLEQSYVLTMLERNSIDTICHGTRAPPRLRALHFN